MVKESMDLLDLLRKRGVEDLSEALRTDALRRSHSEDRRRAR